MNNKIIKALSLVDDAIKGNHSTHTGYALEQIKKTLQDCLHNKITIDDVFNCRERNEKLTNAGLSFNEILAYHFVKKHLSIRGATSLDDLSLMLYNRDLIEKASSVDCLRAIKKGVRKAVEYGVADLEVIQIGTKKTHYQLKKE